MGGHLAPPAELVRSLLSPSSCQKRFLRPLTTSPPWEGLGLSGPVGQDEGSVFSDGRRHLRLSFYRGYFGHEGLSLFPATAGPSIRSVAVRLRLLEGVLFTVAIAGCVAEHC